MYQKSKDTRWHQDKDPERLDCKLSISIIQHFYRGGRILELGTGLGFFGNMIENNVENAAILGTDISKTAVTEAGKKFPRIAFKVHDLTVPVAESSLAGEEFDFVVLRGCIWYLFPQMERVVENIAALTAPGGNLFVSQNFPPLDAQFCGKEVVPSPEALQRYFNGDFKIVASTIFNDRSSQGGNDLWCMFVGEKPR